jgi:hypothetical protein
MMQVIANPKSGLDAAQHEKDNRNPFDEFFHFQFTLGSNRAPSR